MARSSRRRCFVRIGVLRNFVELTGKHLWPATLLNKAEAYNLILKVALSEVLSCEFCELSRNTLFTEHLQATASFLNKFVSEVLQFTLTNRVIHVNQIRLGLLY